MSTTINTINKLEVATTSSTRNTEQLQYAKFISMAYTQECKPEIKAKESFPTFDNRELISIKEIDSGVFEVLEEVWRITIKWFDRRSRTWNKFFSGNQPARYRRDHVRTERSIVIRGDVTQFREIADRTDFNNYYVV